MKIGLYNLEPHIVNTAMMQVSQYHKGRGDQVYLYNHLTPKAYDKVYAFSIFNFTDKGMVPKDAVCGGTGFDIKSRLPEEIEASDYDWSLYSSCDHSIVWFSRGCIRACPFCVVQSKEGRIRSVRPKNLNPNGQYVVVQDNNFFANPEWREAIKQLQTWKQPVDFQGVDARIMTEEQAKALLTLKHRKQIKIAWDLPQEDLEPQLQRIITWIKPYRLMCYVFICRKYTHEQNVHRLDVLRSLKIDPFIMPEEPKEPYQQAMARYVNMKAIYKSKDVTLEQYLAEKGIEVPS